MKNTSKLEMICEEQEHCKNCKGLFACQNSLEKYLNKQPGVIKATVNLVLAQAQITYDDNLTIKDLEKYVAEAGFKSEGVFKALKEKKNYIIWDIPSLKTIF